MLVARFRRAGHWVAACQAMLLLLVQLVEGTGVHRCPQHDGMPGMHHAMAAGHAAGHESHGGKGPALCHCLGTCSAPLAWFLPASRPVSLRSIAVVAPPEQPTVRSLRASVRLLPFAIGPPLLT